MENITLAAIADTALWEVLEKEGVLEGLDAGTCFCYVTGELLTRDTVGGLVTGPLGSRPIKDSWDAMRRGGDGEFLKRLNSFVPEVLEVWGTEEAGGHWLRRRRDCLDGRNILDIVCNGELERARRELERSRYLLP